MIYIIKSIRLLQLKRIILNYTIKKTQTDNVKKRKNQSVSLSKPKCIPIRR